jgi:hypothetical protein
VIVKRSKVNMTKYNQNLDFNLLSDVLFIPGIRLPAGQDYGFARFRKNNDVWEMDSNYKINLTRTAQGFASNTTVSASGLTKSKIYVANGVRLTVNGGTVSNKSRFYLGNNAELLFTSNTTVDLSGTVFQPISSGDQYDWVKIQGYAECDNCRFTGGNYNLIIDNGSHEVRLTETRLEHGNYGLWVAGGYGWLRGCDIRYNDSHGVYASGDALLTINREPLSNGSFVPSRIYGNGGSGLYLTGTSQTFLGRSRVQDNGAYNEIWVDYSARLTAGGRMGFDDPPGSNRLLAGTGRYIYSRSQTSSGSWIVPAEENYWGGSEPSSSRLYGEVDYEPWYEGDPSIPGNDPGPLVYHPDDGDGGGGGGGGPGDPILQSVDTRSLSEMAAVPNNTEAALHESRIERVVSRLEEIYSEIERDPGHVTNAGFIREASRLAGLLQRLGEKTAMGDFHRRLLSWRQYYRQQDEAPARAVYKATLLADLYTRMKKREVLSVDQSADQYGPFMDDALSYSEMLTTQAIAWQQSGDYGRALNAYAEIEQLAETIRNPEGIDLLPVKTALKDSIEVFGPGRSPGMAGKKKEFRIQLPEEFVVRPVRPNPFKSGTTIRFGLPEAARVRVEVYDVLGRRVLQLADRAFAAGYHNLPLEGSGLSSGVYLVRIDAEDDFYTQKVTLVK